MCFSFSSTKFSFTLGYNYESIENKRKEKKKINQSKIEEKQKKRKEKEKFFEHDNVWTMRRIVRKKENSNNDLVKTRGMRGAIPFLVTNKSLYPLLFHAEPKRKGNKKERLEHPKAKFPTKIQLPKTSCWSMITHIIFDLMGNDLQSQIMTCLWFGVRMKHLPVWDFIHFERFSSISIGPNVFF